MVRRFLSNAFKWSVDRPSRPVKAQRRTTRPIGFDLLEDRSVPATLYWQGAVNPAWSAAANWSTNSAVFAASAVAPASGDTIVFDTTRPWTIVSFATTNDIAALTGLAIQVIDNSAANDFALSGNGVGLSAAGFSNNLTAGTATTLSFSSALTMTTATSIIGSDAGLVSIANDIADSGTLTFSGAGNVAVIGAITGGAAGAVTKIGGGTLTLTGANTCSGPTTVSGGTMIVGNGTTGNLNGTTGTDLTIAGTSTIVFNEGPGVSQGMGTLTFSGGEGTIVSTFGGGSTTNLTFASLAPRAKGAVGNLVLAGGTAGTAGVPGTLGTNNIVFAAGVATGLIDKGISFGGSDFAYRDQAGFVRAPVYDGVADGPTFVTVGGGATLGTISSATNVRLTGPITSQTAGTAGTIKIDGAFDIALAGSLTASAILKAGSGVSTISGSSINIGGNELVVRSGAASDSVMISSLLSGTGAETKAGLGSLMQSAASTFSGGLFLDSGTLVAGSSSTGFTATPSPVGTGLLTFAGGTIQADASDRTLSNPLAVTGNVTFGGAGLLTFRGITQSVTGDNVTMTFTASKTTFTTSSFLVSGNNLAIATTDTGGATFSPNFTLNTNKLTIASFGTGTIFFGGNFPVNAANTTISVSGSALTTIGGTIDDSAAAATGFNIINNGPANLTVGNLQVGSNNVSATAAAGVITFGGGVTYNGGQSVTLAGPGGISFHGTFTGAGPLTFAGLSTMVCTLGGTIVSSGGFNVNGPEMVFNSTASTTGFTGGITLTSGKITAAASSNFGATLTGAFGSGPITLLGGTFRSSSGTGRSIGNSLLINGNVLFSSVSTGPLTFQGGVTLGAASNLTFSTVLTTFTTGTSPFVLGAFDLGVSTTSGGSVSFNSGLTYSGGRTITTSGSSTINFQGAMTGISSPSLTLAGTGSNVFFGNTIAVTGTTGGVIVNGPTVTFGVGTSSFTGGMTLTSGTVLFTASSTPTTGTVTASPFGVGNITINGTSTIKVSGATARTLANGFIVNTSGIATIGAATGSGNLTLTGTTETISGSPTLNFVGTTTTFGAVSLSSDFTASGSGIGIFGGTISETAPSNITYNGAGQIQLRAANTYSGTTTVAAGTIAFNNASAFGTGSSDIIVGNGTGDASLIDGIPLVLPFAATLSRNITVAAGAGNRIIGSNNSDTTASYTGNIALNKDVDITCSLGGTPFSVNRATSFSGVISGPGGIFIDSTFSNDAGTVAILNAANSYTGKTIIRAGTLRVAGGGTNNLGSLGSPAAGNEQVILGDTSGAHSVGLRLDDATTFARPLLVRSGSIGTATLFQSGTSANFTGDIQLQRNLTILTNGSTTVAGGISGAATLFLRAMASTLVVSGNNTYTGGTVVTGTGISSVGAASSLGSGNVVILGGTLRLGAAANLAAGKSVTIGRSDGSLSVLAVAGDFLPIIDPSSSNGVIALETTSGPNFNAAVADMSTLGDGTLFLGSTTNGTFTGTLSPGAGSNYRLGGGGGNLTINTVGALSGTVSNVIVGNPSALAHGAGVVSITATQTYGGSTAINVGSTLSGVAPAASGESPFGSTTGSLAISNGTLVLVSALNGLAFAKGATTFDGTSRVVIDTSAGGSASFGFDTLTPSANHPVLNLSAIGGGTLGTAPYRVRVLTSPPIPVNGTIGPNYLFGTTDFASYDASFGFVAATGELSQADFTGTDATSVLSLTGSPSVGTSVSAYALRLNANAIMGTGTITLAAAGLTAGSASPISVAPTVSLPNGNTVFSASSNASANNVLKSLTGGGANAFLTAAAGDLAFDSTTANSFVGTYVVNYGALVDFVNDSSFGGLANGIYLNGGTLNTISTASGTLLSSLRTVTVGSGGGTIGGFSNAISEAEAATIVGAPGSVLNFVQNPDIATVNVILPLAGDLSGFQGTLVVGFNVGTNGFGLNPPANLGSQANFVDQGSRMEIFNTGTIAGGRFTNEAATSVHGAGVTMSGVLAAFGSLAGGVAGAAIVLGGGSDTTLNVGSDNTSSSYYGTIGQVSGRSGIVTKVGTGTLSLFGNETYTGPTTVSAGGLIVNGSLSASSAVSVSPGAILGGSGTVGAVTSSGTISPGAAGVPGSLTTGNLSLSSAILALDLASTSSYDSIRATGAVIDITGATLSLNVGTASPGDTFTLISIPGTNPAVQSVTGRFNGLPNTGSTVTIGTKQFAINYAGGDGNDVTLAAVGGASLVGSPVRNGGSPYVNSTNFTQQHSMVESIAYSFSSAINLTAANFTLTGINGTTLAPTVTPTGSAGNTIWTVTFAGDGVNLTTHSLGDGEYRLTLNVGSTSSTYDFFRMFGDLDGNGITDFSDFQSFNSSFNRPTTDPLYIGAADFDGSNTVDFSDFQIFNSNFNHSLPAPLPPN